MGLTIIVNNRPMKLVSFAPMIGWSTAMSLSRNPGRCGWTVSVNHAPGLPVQHHLEMDPCGVSGDKILPLTGYIMTIIIA